MKRLTRAVDYLSTCRSASGSVVDKLILPSCLEDTVDHEVMNAAFELVEWEPPGEKFHSPTGCGYDSDDWDDEYLDLSDQTSSSSTDTP